MEYAAYIALGIGAAWLLRENSKREKMSGGAFTTIEPAKPLAPPAVYGAMVTDSSRAIGPRPRMADVAYDEMGIAEYVSTNAVRPTGASVISQPWKGSARTKGMRGNNMRVQF